MKNMDMKKGLEFQPFFGLYNIQINHLIYMFKQV